MDAQVLIVGGGLNGLLTAHALKAAGISTRIIDPNPDAKPLDGRAYALAATSVSMLRALGLWPKLQENAQPITDIKVSDGAAGQGAHPWFLHFDHTEIEEGPLGAMIEDTHLRVALQTGIEIDQGEVMCQSIEPGHATLTLTDNTSLTARLIIGCDGRFSATATRAKIKRQGWNYDQKSLVATLAHEQPHQGTAHQMFMPSGPLAILPLTGNRSSIVWTETANTAAHIETLDDAAFLNYLKPRFGDFLGQITLAGPRYSYPLGLSMAESFIAPRLALVGDAAHGIHPLAGQGLNLGIRDTAALAETLAEAQRRGEDIGSEPVLTRYQTWRRFDANMLGFVTDNVNRLFSTANPLLSGIRRAGLGAINKTPALRQRMMREAAGLTGDLPRLMQGKPL